MNLSSCVYVLVSFLLQSNIAEADNATIASTDSIAQNCTCFKINATDSTSGPSYFTKYVFFDFSQLSSLATTPNLISPSQSHGQEHVTNSLFSNSKFAQNFAVQNWNQSKSKTDKTVSTVDVVNSPQNIFIGRDEDDLFDRDTDDNNPTYLTLRTSRLQGFQSTAELDSPFEMLHASFRVSARVGGGSGACAGIFFYGDDENESDIEILTRDPQSQFRATNQPTVDDEGDEIPGASTIVKIPTPPQNGDSNAQNINSDYRDFNDYRLDWLLKSTHWVVNGNHVTNKTYGVPKEPAAASLNMWSNGGIWTGNMTVGDTATLDIRWIELVWNSTDEETGVGCGAGAVMCDVDTKGGAGQLVPPSQKTEESHGGKTIQSTSWIAISVAAIGILYEISLW